MLARAYAQRAEAVHATDADPEADSEAWRFAQAKIDDLLARLTPLLEQDIGRASWVRGPLDGLEGSVLHSVGRDLRAFIDALSPVGEGASGDPSMAEDPTPRPRTYPSPTLADKARGTDEAIIALGTRLTDALRVLLTAAETFTLEPHEGRLLSRLAVRLDERLRQRAHWLSLEWEARWFLDLLARFRQLCIAYDRIRAKRDDAAFHASAMEAFRFELTRIRSDLGRHPLGSSLQDLCTVQAFASEVGRQRVRRRLLNLEAHALDGYGIPRPRAERLGRQQVERVRRQERELTSAQVRTAFLIAFFRSPEEAGK